MSVNKAGQLCKSYRKNAGVEKTESIKFDKKRTAPNYCVTFNVTQ